MTKSKLFGQSVTGHAASLATTGGLVAERNRIAADVAVGIDQLTDRLFAYLPQVAGRSQAERRFPMTRIVILGIWKRAIHLIKKGATYRNVVAAKESAS